MEEIVKILTEKGLTISTMESCTGGGVVDAITSIPGASEVLKFSAVTYSNEFKIKMGVSKEIIDKYSVYSMEVAREMAKCISEFALSDIGIGITGKLKKVDPYNDAGADDQVFISIYYNKQNYDYSIEVTHDDRKESKKEVIDKITSELLNILKAAV